MNNPIPAQPVPSFESPARPALLFRWKQPTPPGQPWTPFVARTQREMAQLALDALRRKPPLPKYRLVLQGVTWRPGNYGLVWEALPGDWPADIAHVEEQMVRRFLEFWDAAVLLLGRGLTPAQAQLAQVEEQAGHRLNGGAA